MTIPSDLARVSLFAKLSARELESVAGQLKHRSCARSEAVFHAGDMGDSLYIIEEGVVTISITSPEGHEVVLAELQSGQFFGEMALLDDEPRSADAIVKEDTKLLVLERETFQRFMHDHPGAALNLLAVLSNRLRRTDQLLYQTETDKIAAWNLHLEQALQEMTRLNGVFRSSLGERSGLISAYGELLEAVQSLADEAQALATGPETEIPEGVRRLAQEIGGLVRRARDRSWGPADGFT
jgi:CRP-like cAMP-binding protein